MLVMRAPIDELVDGSFEPPDALAACDRICRHFAYESCLLKLWRIETHTYLSKTNPQVSNATCPPRYGLVGPKDFLAMVMNEQFFRLDHESGFNSWTAPTNSQTYFKAKGVPREQDYMHVILVS